MSLHKLDIEKIYSAFSPAKEITEPQLFAGRREEIRSGILGLLNRGGFMAIYGLRGVGKSSIAIQIAKIAEGNTTLPKMMAMSNLLPRRGFNYIVHYYRSDTFVKNIGDLLKRILFGDENNPSLFSLTKAGDRKLEEFRRVIKVEGSAGIFGSKAGASGKEEKVYKSYVSDDLVQQFRALLGTIQKDNHKRTGILILIDEFDTIPDKTGFASIVKACSSDFVKFGVVGIGANVAELLRDHTSIGRQIDTIQVPLMPSDELHEIIKKAEYVVGREIIFDEDASRSIVEKSEGFPYFTHLLGKEAMVLAFERGSQRVDMKDIEALSRKISEGRLKTIYEDIYHDAVGHSPQREILLKIFAEHEEDVINTEEVYALARELDISNPSQLMKQLTNPDNPHAAAVLVKVRERYYRFSDPVFKTYARLRAWKFC